VSGRDAVLPAAARPNSTIVSRGVVHPVAEIGDEAGDARAKSVV